MTKGFTKLTHSWKGFACMKVIELDTGKETSVLNWPYRYAQAVLTHICTVDGVSGGAALKHSILLCTLHRDARVFNRRGGKGLLQTSPSLLWRRLNLGLPLPDSVGKKHLKKKKF